MPSRSDQEVELPDVGSYATGMLFLDPDSYRQAKDAFGDLALGCGLQVVAWRRPAVNSNCIGSEARKTEPYIRQVTEGLLRMGGILVHAMRYRHYMSTMHMYVHVSRVMYRCS